MPKYGNGSAAYQHRVLHRIGEKARWRCVYCNCQLYCAKCNGELPLNAGRPITRDHRIPVGRGGPRGVSNMVASCGPCNHAKGDRMPGEPKPKRVKQVRPGCTMGRHDGGNKRAARWKIFETEVHARLMVEVVAVRHDVQLSYWRCPHGEHWHVGKRQGGPWKADDALT